MIQIHNNSKANVPPNQQKAIMKNLNFEAVLATILCYRQIKQYYCFQRKKFSRKHCMSTDV